MKTKNLLKKAFLLLALMGGTTSAWATPTVVGYTETINGTNLGARVLSKGELEHLSISSSAFFGSAITDQGSKTVYIDNTAYTNNKSWRKSVNSYENQFVGYTLSVGTGYKLNISNVNARIAVADDTYTWYVEILNSIGTQVWKSSEVTTTKASSGKIDNVDVSAEEDIQGLTGDVTVKLWVKQGGSTKYFSINYLQLSVELVKAAGTKPTITTQPASATYVVDASPAALTVEASASAGDLSYQWYKNTDQDKTAKEADKIAGATSATLEAANISTAAVGTTYYYVVVTDGNGSTTSDLATITVVNGIAPDVSAAISASAVRAETTVTLTATVNAGTPAPTLQWYTCDSDGSNESPIDGATNTTYQPSTASTGTYYFKVKAHNDSGDDYSDVLKLTVIAQGVSGAASDLETISSNYTFIADNHTGNGVVGFTSGYLYDDSRIFSPLGNAVATNKGKSTIDGVEYFNSLRVKANSQDVLAFKVGGACYITFYAETTGKNPARPIKVGNDVNNDSYGTISDANEDHIVYIPSAGTVYLTGSSDRFIAGFKVTFTVTATIGSTGWTTFSSGYALDLSNMTASTGTVTAYYASETSAESVIMTPTNSSAVIANEGLMLKGTAGATITIPVVATGSALPGNKLVGCYNGETLSKDASKYVLVNNSGTAVFQSLEDNGATIPAGKAYLDVSLASPARALRIAFASDITGINEAEATTTEAVAQEGKFIENGKLVIVKNGKKFNANGAILK